MTAVQKWNGSGKPRRRHQDSIVAAILSLERRGLIEFSDDGETVRLTTAGKILACAEQIRGEN
jgi:hypothetical protein